MRDAADSATNAGQLPSEDACPQPDPSNDPAQETQPGAEDLEAEFQSAQAAAIEKGKVFTVSEGDYHVKLADLLPELSRVRKNLHQRQDGYKKGRRNGAPNWGKWLKFFRAETSVTLCDRAIKKLIDEHEGIKPVPRPKKVRAKTITPAEARQMGLTLLAVHEALGKINDHGNVLLVAEDIAAILEMAPSPQQLDRLLESLGQEAEAAEPSKIASAAAPGPADTAGTPAAHPLAKESPQAPLKSGDVAGLTDRLIERSVQDFEAVLGNLPPDAFADAIGTLADRVQKKFRRPDFGRISVRASHIPRKPIISPKRRPGPDPEQPSLLSASLPSFQVA